MSPFTVDQLPVELIQKIVQPLPRKDQLALSMVSTYLRAATSPVVFHAINITGKKVENVDEVPKRLMEKCVRSIFYRVGPDTYQLYSGSDYGTFLNRHLNNFPLLTSLHLALSFWPLDSELTKHLHCVQDLTLEECRVTSKGLATLVNSPSSRLTRLTLSNVKHCPGEEHSPSASPRRSPRKLSIGKFSFYGFKLLDVIFSVSWDRLSILSGNIDHKLAAIHFIDHANSNLECLELQENLINSTYRDCPAIPIPWEC